MRRLMLGVFTLAVWLYVACQVRRLREAIAEQKGDKEGLEAAPHLDTIEDLKVYAASHEDADTPSRVG